MKALVSLSLLALFACGGSSSNTGGGGTTDSVAQLTIKGTGITTQTGNPASGISVPTPGFLVFTNSDNAAHAIASSTGGCGQLNTGTLAAGAVSSQLTLTNTTSANLTCNYADTLNPTNTALQGSITVLTSNTGGSGY